MNANPERGLIQILATEESGGGRLELWFTLPALTLSRVVKIAGDRRIDLIVHDEQESYFGWSPAYPVIFDWPQIPAARQHAKREFTNDEGLQVEEVLQFPSASQFEITMTSRRKIDEGYLETRRSTQLWAAGSPWWSNAAIETEYNIDGEVSRVVNIRARLAG